MVKKKKKSKNDGNTEQNADVFEDLVSVEDINPEQILNQLLNKKKLKFHTEIHNPISISTLDLLANYYEDLELKDILKKWLSYFRINMTSYQRKRSTEIVEAYKSRAEEEKEKRKIRDLMLGST